jgi:pathogenesis-related protein 1
MLCSIFRPPLLTASLMLCALGWAGCEFADTRPRDASIGTDGPRPPGADARPLDTRPPDGPIDLRSADNAPARDGPTASDTGSPPPPLDVRDDVRDVRPDMPMTQDSAPIEAPPADAQPPDTPAGDPEPGKLAGFTRLHNELRAQVSVAGLVWDPALASIAQAYADGCRFQHSGRDGVGENLAANAPPGNTVAQAFKTWADEQASYNYASNSCAAGKDCGHYTQVVWRNTTRLGCGVTSCTTGSPFSGFPSWELWVCNYAPPGNFAGQRPY